MAHLRCPNCGRTEYTNLQGNYLVECSECKQKFTTYLLRNKSIQKIRVTCPECGYSELLPLSKETHLKITCGECGTEFVL